MSYVRRHTQEVCIGGIAMGGVHPIRVQSMTTTDTMDTEGTIAQVLSLHAQGSAYVRLTVPNISAARHLEEIKKGLKAQNCKVPLIADVHFTPRVAEEAARRVEKVRINPGNYVDSKRFVHTDYDEASYGDILSRLASRLRPLLSICREYGTALRIGTNHGSLSDRIMSRYGDTPRGDGGIGFRVCTHLRIGGFLRYCVVYEGESSAGNDGSDAFACFFVCNKSLFVLILCIWGLRRREMAWMGE